MRRPMLFAAALTALLLFPAAAAAKGPSAATISGPGPVARDHDRGIR